MVYCSAAPSGTTPIFRLEPNQKAVVHDCRGYYARLVSGLALIPRPPNNSFPI